MTKQWPPSQ